MKASLNTMRVYTLVNYDRAPSISSSRFYLPKYLSRFIRDKMRFIKVSIAIRFEIGSGGYLSRVMIARPCLSTRLTAQTHVP